MIYAVMEKMKNFPSRGWYIYTKHSDINSAFVSMRSIEVQHEESCGVNCEYEWKVEALK